MGRAKILSPKCDSCEHRFTYWWNFPQRHNGAQEQKGGPHLSEVKKHCNTCEHSYRTVEQSIHVSRGAKTQHCASIDYNSDDYTHEMFMEDWGKGNCRFWTPQKERIDQHEKQLFHRPAQ